MIESSIEFKKWGPITAAMYVTLENTIIVKGEFYDEELDVNYPGPSYELTKIPEELITLKREHPNRYKIFQQWREFIKFLWKRVEDNPWFRYDL